jgi:hypothetical protein
MSCTYTSVGIVSKREKERKKDESIADGRQYNSTKNFKKRRKKRWREKQQKTEHVISLGKTSTPTRLATTDICIYTI